MVAKKAKIVIIGAGMAGLTAAHRLHTLSGDLFDLSVVEAGDRIGGRILTDDFAGDRVEIGATWIHGIGGSPVYTLAGELGLLHDSRPWERMDGFPTNPLTVAEGGAVVDEELIAGPISTLYRRLMDDARSGDAVPADGDPGVGAYLRRGLRDYQACRPTALSGYDTYCSQEALENAVFAMNEHTERTCTSADDLADLNLAAESEYRDFPGDQITIAKGYSRIVEHLASALPPGVIRLNCQIRRIEWCPDGGGPPAGAAPVCLHFTDGTAMPADHVIVTVSLGVLKAGLGKEGGISFDPALPAFKREAIARLGWGVVNKLFMELETESDKMETEKENEKSFPFLQLAFHQERGEEGLSRHVAKIPWWIRKTESICPLYGGSHVLLAWFAGKEATHLESLDDEEIISGVHATLDSFLPASGGAGYANSHRLYNGNGSGGGESNRRITRVKRSRWSTDPLFLGSYSYVSAGSSGDDLDLMAEPLPRGGESGTGGGPGLQILFGGEATHRTHYSTTHGAYFSGIREANRLLHFYRCGYSNCF